MPESDEIIWVETCSRCKLSFPEDDLIYRERPKLPICQQCQKEQA